MTRLYWAVICVGVGTVFTAALFDSSPVRAQENWAETVDYAAPLDPSDAPPPDPASSLADEPAKIAPEMNRHPYADTVPTARPAAGDSNSQPAASNCGCSDSCGLGCGCDPRFGHCPNLGCPACNSCFPKLYVQGGAMFLWRDNRSINQPVVLSDTSTVIDTRTTDFDTGIGPRVLLGLRTSPCSSWSIYYFSAFDFQGSASATIPGSLSAPGLLGATGIDWVDADTMATSYWSDLHNVEINYMHDWNDFSLLAGFRFVDLEETYNITTISETDTSFYNTATHNELYGAQIGGRYRRCCGRFFWDATGKAGVFGNAAQQSQYLSDLDNSIVYRDSISHHSTIAFVGDVNLSVGFQLTRCLAFRCGYNAMWIGQVALAPDQLDFDISSLGTTINTGGDVFLQGINIGFEGHW